MKCPICLEPAEDISPPDLDGQEIRCPRHGDYVITRTIRPIFDHLGPLARQDAFSKARHFAADGGIPFISTKCL